MQVAHRMSFCQKATPVVTRAFLCLSGWLVLAVSTHAQGEVVNVQMLPCANSAAGWDKQQMLEIVRVEISPKQLALPDPSVQAVLLVDACDPNRLVLRDQTGPQPVVRELWLDDVPNDLRPRVAALAVAELASNHLSAPQPKPSPVAKLTTKVRAKLVLERELLPRPPASKYTEAWLGLSAEGRVFLTEVGPNFGPRLTWAVRHVELGVVTLVGRQTAAAGTVSTGVLAAAMDYPFWRSMRARDVSLAAGGELGMTWAKGKLLDAGVEQTSGAQKRVFAAGLMRLNWGGQVAPTTYAQIAWALGYSQGLNASVMRRKEATTHGPFVAMTATIAWVP